MKTVPLIITTAKANLYQQLMEEIFEEEPWPINKEQFDMKVKDIGGFDPEDEDIEAGIEKIPELEACKSIEDIDTYLGNYWDDREMEYEFWMKLATKMETATTMSTKEFESELKLLLTKTNMIPTRAFCDKFQERLPEEDQIPEEFQGRDAEDYESWGYALWGYFEDAENIMYELKLWYWIGVYDALDNGDLKGFLEDVEVIQE